MELMPRLAPALTLALSRRRCAPESILRTHKKKDNHWDIWVDYCSTVTITPFFDNVHNPITYLQVFTHRYRDSQIAARVNAIKSTQVSDVL